MTLEFFETLVEAEQAVFATYLGDQGGWANQHKYCTYFIPDTLRGGVLCLCSSHGRCALDLITNFKKEQ